MIIESILYALGLFGFLWFHWFWVKVVTKSEKYDNATRITMGIMGMMFAVGTGAAIFRVISMAAVGTLANSMYIITILAIVYAFLGFCGLVRMARGVKV